MNSHSDAVHLFGFLCIELFWNQTPAWCPPKILCLQKHPFAYMRRTAKVQMWGCALFHFPKLFLVARHFSNHGEQRARAQESTHPHRLQGWRSGDSFKWSACPERPTSSPCFLESWTDPQLRFWSRLSTQKFWNHCDWLTCLWLAGGWGLTRAERLDYGDGEQKVLAAIRSIWHFIRNPPL